jgi:ABC-type long-subunit fatty acid transport system fused permease/ATPase subunit
MGHLKEIKSNYFKHFLYSSYFNILALLILITGIIHSIFPFLFPFLPYKLAKQIVYQTEEKFLHQERNN